MPPRVAMVTGGASGMGRIMALRMARRGTRVAILDRHAENLENTAGESDHLTAHLCDVSDSRQVEEVIAWVRRELGPIDRAVHCAAVMPTARLVDQDREEILRLMTVNYGGTVNVSKAVLPAMVERGAGELVLFGSIGGSVPVPECGAYCASKAAINTFAEMLIEETRGSGVHVMLVCPSLVNTPLLEQATATSNPKSIRDSIANKRFADPELIVDEVEKGLTRRKEILLPGTEAKVLMWVRRLAPRLLWKVIHLSSRE
jgi:short-subunit dehydrogenase